MLVTTSILRHMCISVSMYVVHQVATQFKGRLATLAEVLLTQEPSYVRCIKPNDEKKPCLTICMFQ